MTRKMGYRWHLRQVMATRGMFATSDLVGPLAERGVQLSREQVFRLVTATPERLNLHVLAALCDILECGPGELIEPVAEQAEIHKSARAGEREVVDMKTVRPVRARLLPPAE
jgi:DNA-binding Xre family transcriptional regulator